MKLLCLLPVRNGAQDLPLYLESAAGFADGVVALDDGSTDETAEALASSDLVVDILSNPRREAYAGWDDLENRIRLLRAAEKLQPDWIIWLDADEILEPSDAAVLRRFLEEEARPRVAYSLEVLRMIDDMQTYDKCAMWMYRLYSFEPGYTFPASRLHFKLVPEQFAPDARCRTNLRILHRASLTEERRRARYDKYGECDAGREFQPSYENILDPPRNLKPIRPRGPGEPVVMPPIEDAA
jgi:hypothetical protein